MKNFEDLLSPYPQVFVVYDKNVEKFALEVAGGRRAFPIVADEAHKTLSSVEQICRWLLSEGADRDALVLAIGGGVTTDMAGFAASIYKRGVRYANIPTTLLSMVDAAIGGKTGVNFDSYKNMLGVIVQPEFTYLWPESLNTLPAREWRSGMAELLKTFLIRDAAGYERALKVLHSGFKELPEVISAAASIKQEVVNEDPYEKGLRRILNLGHTYAHAIEWYQGADGEGKLSHGEAVAIGIVAAAKVSENTGTARAGLAKKIEDDFRSCGLPVELPCPVDNLLSAMLKDKKAEGGKINFVLLEDIGKSVVKELSIEEIRI